MLDIVPDFLTNSCSILCMIDNRIKGIIESEIEKKSIDFYYLDYASFDKKIDKWMKDIKYFESEIQSFFEEEKINSVVFSFHPFFEDEITSLVKKINLLDQYDVYGSFFDESTGDEEIPFYFQLPNQNPVAQN